MFNHLTAFYKYHSPGGTHKLHADTDKPGRVLTATLTLNEAGIDYQGGRQTFYDGYPLNKVTVCRLEFERPPSVTHGFAVLQEQIEVYQEEYFRSGKKPAVVNQFAGKSGTLTLFLSENLHDVGPLTSGERYVMLNWMTCYPEEEHAYDDKDLNKKIRLREKKKKNAQKKSRRKKKQKTKRTDL